MENVRSARKAEAKVAEGAGQVGLGVILTSAASIGVWASLCFVSALAQNGVVAMVKGWFMAVGG